MFERTDIKAHDSNENISVGKEGLHFYSIFISTISTTLVQTCSAWLATVSFILLMDSTKNF